MAHGRTAAFDKDDGQMMRVLADFAAMAVRHQRQQHALLQQARAAASAEMANKLAHRINNPLQSLMQVAYLAAEGQSDHNAKTLGQEVSAHLLRLSAVVTESLALPQPVAAGINTCQPAMASDIEFADAVTMVGVSRELVANDGTARQGVPHARNFATRAIDRRVSLR
jgi:signal transduction histidine kinase